MPENSPQAPAVSSTPPTRPPTASRPYAVRQRVWTAGRVLLLAGGLGLTFGVFFLTAFAVATRAREVRVPDVRGKTVAEATAALATVGLASAVDPARRADAKVPAGHVLTQEPDPGSTLRRQRPVRLRISDGQRDPVVPAVVGQPDQAASALLAQGGVSVGARIDVHSTDSAVGAVVAQDPPGKGRAQSVTLIINRGLPDQSFVMPDLIGTMGDRAAQV